MKYDITFIGHMCLDEIRPYQAPARTAPGSAVLCGAMAAGRIGKKVNVITRMAPADDAILDPMRQCGIDTVVIPSAATSFMRVIHPVADVDVRQMFQVKNAGYFTLDELPPLSTAQLHLAGITDQEFTLPFMRGLRDQGYNLSTDMQSFVRQVDGATREIFFRDVPAKTEIIPLMNKLKLDVVEAKILTGLDDLERSAVRLEAWGCREVVITQSSGVLARVKGRTYYEKFTNSSVVGRTGRGDTTFAAYLSWRMDHDVAESLRFAATLVSIKMESPGPFAGTLEQVLERMKEKRS